MQCSVSSDYGTSILNSSEININEHNNITITITSYYGLLFVVLLNKTVVCYSPFTYWEQPELLSAAQNISNNTEDRGQIIINPYHDYSSIQLKP